MTVSYILDTSTSTVGSFLKILIRWRGSVWKSVLIELIIWIILYYIIFIIYRFNLDTTQQKIFESIGKHIDNRLHLLPLTFMLGFFVTIVVDRWKNIFQNIGFIDSAAFYINTYIRGDEKEIINQRKTILRYLCLTQVLVLRDISVPVRKRFPNIDSIVDSGLLKKNELKIIENIPSDGFNNYWIPINWIFVICYKLRLNGNIVADMLMNSILIEVKLFKEKLQTLCNYDWVPVPLAYPQVVFLAVRIYFMLCLISRQYRINENEQKQNEEFIQVDRILPLMTILELFFIMGWVKVAEALLNPLGEDDDDFECNFIIDRNIAMSMTITNICYDQKPEQNDQSNADLQPSNLTKDLVPLYAENIATQPQHPLVGSATMFNLSEEYLPVKMVEKPKRGSNAESISNNIQSEYSLGKSLYLRRFSNISFKRLNKIRSTTIPKSSNSKIDNEQCLSPNNLQNINIIDSGNKNNELFEGKQNYDNSNLIRKLSAPILLNYSLNSQLSPDKNQSTKQFQIPLEPLKEDENMEEELNSLDNKIKNENKTVE